MNALRKKLSPKSNPSAPLVYIVILSYNGITWLKKCLTSVLNSDYENYKIILVDNASKDDSVGFVEVNYPGIKVIVSRQNLGFAGGMNIGIRQALAGGADQVFLLNQDTQIDGACLRELVAVAQAHEGIGLLVPVQFRYGSHDLHQIFHKWLRFNLGFEAQTLLSGSGPDYYEVPAASGAAMLISIRALKVVGLLDAQYFSYFEETDLCRRLRFHGFKIGLCPKAHFWHAEDLSAPWKTMLLGRSHLIFSLKDPFHHAVLNVFRALDVLIRNLVISALHFDIANIAFMMLVCRELALNLGEIQVRRRSEMLGFSGLGSWWRDETDHGAEARSVAALSKIRALLGKDRNLPAAKAKVATREGSPQSRKSS
jgi:GT2 family glycosyltransferase